MSTATRSADVTDGRVEGGDCQAAITEVPLRRNFAWTLAGNVVYAGCQWAMLTVIAKVGTAELVGRFALALAVTAPAIAFSNLSLRQLQATDARREYAFGHYLALRLAATTVALAAICGWALAAYLPEQATVIAAMGLAKAIEAVSDVYYGYIQYQERMDRIAQSMILKGVGSLCALCAVVYATHSVALGALALAAVWLTVLCAFDRRVALQLVGGESEMPRPMAPSWEWPRLWKLGLLGAPLGGVMLLISLNTNIPRYVIERGGGERALGIYAAMAYLMVAGSTVVGALGQSATPRLSKHYAAGDARSYVRLVLRLLLLSCAVGAAGVAAAWLAGGPILALLYRPEYGTEWRAFAWVAGASAVGYLASTFGWAATAARYTGIQLPIAGAATLVVWLVSPPAVGRLGLVGASVAIMMAYALQASLHGATVVWAVARLRRRT